MTREELEKRLVKRFGRAFSEQEKRILEHIADDDLDNALLRNDSFWEDENAGFPWVTTLLVAGAVAGALLGLPDGAPTSNVVIAAERWAHDYDLHLIKEINETSRAIVANALDKFMAGEVDRSGLEALIQESPAFTPARASVVGVTETTRAFTSGQLEAGKELAALGYTPRYIFHTNMDSFICEDCHELEGKEVGEEDFPPVHPNCRCWITTEWDVPEQKTVQTNVQFDWKAVEDADKAVMEWAGRRITQFALDLDRKISALGGAK
jgi:hypothetical protein